MLSTRFSTEDSQWDDVRTYTRTSRDDMYIHDIITRQMLSIVASGSDATVVNGFFHSALVVVRELS